MAGIFDPNNFDNMSLGPGIPDWMMGAQANPDATPPAQPLAPGGQQAQMAPQMAPQAAAPPPSFGMGGFGGRMMNPMTLMGLGLASGRGLGEGAAGAMKGLALANQYQSQQQSQAAAYQAAIAAGANPQQAMALAQNPEAFKALQPQYHVLADMMGQQRLVPTGPFGVGGGSPGGGSADTGMPNTEPSYDEAGKDPAFLDAVKKQYGSTIAEDIKGITEGKMPSQGRRLQTLIPLAMRYDQNFTGAQDYMTRLQTAKSFAAGGKDAAQVKSYNQAITHAEQLWGMVDKMPTTNYGGYVGGVVNPIYQGVATSGSGQEARQAQSQVAEWQRLTQALAGELMQASQGTGRGSVKEIEDWKRGADKAASPAEMRGSIRGAMDFLHGAMQATAEKKTQGLKSQFAPTDLVTQANQKTFQSIHKSIEGPKGSITLTEQGGGAALSPGQVIPQEAMKHLKEGAPTTFKNGQTWTLQNGVPVRVN